MLRCNSVVVRHPRRGDSGMYEIAYTLETDITKTEHLPFENEEALRAGIVAFFNLLECAKTLIIGYLGVSNSFKVKLERDIRVETLYFKEENGEKILNWLTQVEPIYLKKIVLKSDGGNSSIYSTPQATYAVKLKNVDISPTITEEHLLELKTRHIYFRNISCSILRYLDKCKREAGTNFRKFNITGGTAYKQLRALYEFENNRFFLETWSPIMKLELVIDNDCRVKCYTRFTSEQAAVSFCHRDSLMMRQLKKVEIRSQFESWTIIVQRFDFSKHKYELVSSADAQQKINEVLDLTDFINTFEINLQDTSVGIDWKLRERKLIVKDFWIRKNNTPTSLIALIKQIAPEYVETVKIANCNEAVLFYEQPHLWNASAVVIDGPFLRDYLLLQMNAEIFVNKASDEQNPGSTYNNTVTALGINQYIKKCIRNLSRKNHYFELQYLAPNMNVYEIFTGIRILSVEEGHHGTSYVCYTDAEEYRMKVEIGKNGCVIGRRERSSM